MNINKKTKRTGKGFTLLELLIAVAILIVLMAVAIVSVSSVRKNVRQKRLDYMAELVYMVAQNQLTELSINKSNMDRYSSANEDVVALNYVPNDAVIITVEGKDYPTAESLYYTTSWGGATCSNLVPDDKISAEVLQGNFVVEYAPDEAFVYAVYYAEGERVRDYTGSGDDFKVYLRDRSNRLRDGAQVGYYGGDSVASDAMNGVLQPQITVYNSEALVAVISCVSLDAKAVTYDVTVSDGTHEQQVINPVSRQIGNRWVCEVVLDSMESDATRFATQFPQLTAGADITVTATAKSQNTFIDDTTVSVSAIAADDPDDTELPINSLFASVDESGTTAYISCARHLQNLDKNSSGVTDTITKAEQQNDISFRDDHAIELNWFEEDWYTCYENRSFDPITNSSLQSYNGGNFQIAGLSVLGSFSSDSGLFESISNTVSLKDINLTGTYISGGRYVGALVGRVYGTAAVVTVSNCHVVLDNGDVAGKTEDDIWLMGTTVGGLVGRVNTGSVVTIENSYAASVLGSAGSTSYAGGLVGYSAGTVSVSGSYADSYLTGSRTGGLVGFSSNTAAVTLKNSYAAGFQTATSRAAGLVCGPVRNAANVYTVCYYGEDMDSSVVRYSTAASVTGSLKNVFYLAGNDEGLAGSTQLAYDQFNGKEDVTEGVSLTDLLNDGGAVFSANPTVTTVPYNLRDQGLISYNYPSLRGVAHYGDWFASFADGALVYYEVYADGKVGFYGANSNTLKNAVVVGDGYGVVYSGMPTGDLSVRYAVSAAKNETVKLISKGSIVSGSGAKYIEDNVISVGDIKCIILAFPAKVTNNEYASEDFWQKVSVGADPNSELCDNYYINPHFARAIETPLDVDSGASDIPSIPNTVHVRSARQLYSLSLHYEDYRTCTEDSVFSQTTNIDYEQYMWTDYTAETSALRTQEAIGGEDSSFVSTYNGHCHTISGVSFAESTYSGLFGLNQGELINIVAASDAADKCSLTAGSTKNASAYGGVIAAYNDVQGKISNCAAAGYFITSDGYYSSVYTGGLVGCNKGNITNCSADCPSIKLVNYEANAYAGGFVGQNKGVITESYSLTAITLSDNTNNTARSIVVAGFCAANSSKISDCYCAAAFNTTSDPEVYNFSPLANVGEVISGCCYLTGGVFRFADATYSYSQKGGDGEGVSYSDLSKLSLSGFKAAELSRYTTGEDDYPFPCSVKNEDDQYVHYGDWPTGITSDAAGVFYWEHEEGGTNPGYHISFVLDNTNLCTSHDDGGVITEYGYGYFYSKKKNVTEASVSMSGFSGGLSVNEAAKDELEELLKLNDTEKDYVLEPYTTGTDSGELYLTDNVRNGEWTVTYMQNGTKKDVSYYVCPFFGDAFMVKTADDSLVPGNSGNPYLIRTVAQLQFINWNYSTGNCRTDVNEDNYTQYPYLRYASVTSEGTQTESAAHGVVQYWEQTHDIGAESGSGIAVPEANNFWPIAGTSTGSTDRYMTIIIHYLNGNFNAVMYNWFGGDFNGNSYKMTNIGIKSYLNNVGIFGYTCRARLENIILYSDCGTVIQRYTDTTAAKETANVGFLGLREIEYYPNSNDSYAIGGLVGIAYDYADRSSNPLDISNCAIAGYSIEDNCANSRISCGDVNIGGLFGIANANIENCSAVVDIVLDTTFEYYACIGNTIRAGGIAGCCPYHLDNCYSGGSISMGENMKAAINGTGIRPKQQDGFNVVGIGTSAGNFYCTYVYVAGICPGNFGGNFMNFTDSGDFSNDGYLLTVNSARSYYGTNVTQSFNNCYTYMDIEATEGGENIRTYDYSTLKDVEPDDSSSPSTIGVYASLAIGGVPERTVAEGTSWFHNWSNVMWLYDGSTGGVSISNCWYLDSCVTTPEGKDVNYTLGVRYNNGSARDTAVNSGSLKLRQMSDGTLLNKLSGAGFAAVTTSEKNETQYVGSKYSFPGDNQTLLGTVYPFPTIVTQKNAYGETVHVHYGRWPTGTLMFETYYMEADILRDSQSVTLELIAQGGAVGLTPAISFEDEFGDPSDIVSFDSDEMVRENNTWSIPLTLKEPGIVYVNALVYVDGKAVTAKCQLIVTGDFDLTVVPVNFANGSEMGGEDGYNAYLNETSTFKLGASFPVDDDEDYDILYWEAENVHWTVSLDGYDDKLEHYAAYGEAPTDETAVREIKLGNSETITGATFKLIGEGDAIITFTAQYSPDGWDGDTPVGPMLTQEVSAVVTVWTPTVFGVADTTDSEHPVYTEIRHTSPVDEASLTAAQNNSYAAGAAPALRSGDDGTIFLYSSGTDGELYDFAENCTVTVTSASGDYYLEQPDVDDIYTYGSFQVLPIVFNSGMGEYKLTIESDKTAGYIENGVRKTTAAIYTIPITVTRSAPSEIRVSFIANYPNDRGTVTLQTIYIPYDSAAADPNLDAPEHFFWIEGSNWQSADHELPGGSVLKKNTVFYRDLGANTYTFTLVSADESTQATKALVYGVDLALPLYDTLGDAWTDADRFLGWTVRDGEGKTIADILIGDGEDLSAVLEMLAEAFPDTKDYTLYALLGTPGLDSAADETSPTAGEAADESAEAAKPEATPEATPETTPEAAPVVTPESVQDIEIELVPVSAGA